MILDRLENAERYYSMHPGFQPSFEYLRRTDLKNLPAGKHDLDGAKLFLRHNQCQGRGRDAKLEAHRQYIDIQYTVSGPEEIGWRSTPLCRQPDKPFDEKNDIVFFNDSPESYFAVPPGSFAIFFPEDAHAPQSAPVGCDLLKAVLKVAVGWR